MLTGLHAIHVIGGVVSLLVVALRAYRERYSATEYMGVRLVTLYWHFLGAVWLVLVVVLVSAA